MSHSTMYDPKFDAGLWLSSVVDNSGDAILSKTLDGVITSWNAGAEKLFGFSAAEAIGQPITLIIPDYRLHEEAEWGKIEREFHLKTEAGFYVWLDMTTDVETQLKKLKRALPKLDIYKEPLQYIDLRIAGAESEKVIFKRK